MPDKKKRKSPYSYRPPEDRRAAFEQRVAESGLSLNAFITEAVFGRNRHRPDEVKLLAQILVKCASIADAIGMHDTFNTDDTEYRTRLLEGTRAELIAIRSALFLLLGRKP